ncbi:MAG: sodium:solute symporter family protein [Rickettsiaceae bacterium]|nr:sodium:solute symporter family protein [Rickettsiaceae bacterium]
MSFDIDIFIVALFLIATLIVGLRHGKSVKTIKDYALGGRNFSTTALVATIVATYASGSGFFITLAETYSNGFYDLIATMGFSIAFLVTAVILVPRMGEFLGKLSIAEAMGDLFGQKVRLITAIAGTIGYSGVIAAQFKVFGNVFSYFMGIKPTVAIIISGIIATIYSAFGGIRAVTFTDILQAFTFGVIIPMLGFVVWSQFYNSDIVLSVAMSDPKFDLKLLFDSSNLNSWGCVLLFLYFSVPPISAATFQRISMSSNIEQTKKAFIIAAIVFIVIQFAIAWIPFLIYTMNPNISQDHLLSYIVDTYSFTGLKGFIIVAIIAFAMSTADSFINSSSVLFTHDIYGLFSHKKENELFVAKLFSCTLGVGAIILSLIETDLLGIIISANSFYSPLILPPFTLAIFGFRSSAKSVLIGMSVALVITVIWKFLPVGFLPLSQNVIGVLFALICNTLFLIGSHYLLRQKGGWVGIKDNSYLNAQKERKKRRWTNLVKYIKNFSFRRMCRKIRPHNDITYTTLGIYFIICTIATMYSTQVELLGSNAPLMKIIYPLMLVSGTGIAMYQIWPLSVSKYIKQAIIETWYQIAIFYMLIFFSCFFVLVSKFAMLQVLLFGVNLIIASLLLGWRLATPAIIIGFYLSIEFYQHFFRGKDFSEQFWFS